MGVTLEDLKPDDIEGAVEFAKQVRDKGLWGYEAAEVLYNMQTDPDKLMKRLAEEGFE